MIISFEVELAFAKIQHLSIIKIFTELGIEVLSS